MALALGWLACCGLVLHKPCFYSSCNSGNTALNSGVKVKQIPLIYLLKCFRYTSASFPAWSLCSSAQQCHFHRELCSSKVSYTRILSLHVQVKSIHQLKGAASWDPLPKWIPVKTGLEKKTLQWNSAPSYRVKFRKPQEKKRIHSGNYSPTFIIY